MKKLILYLSMIALVSFSFWGCQEDSGLLPEQKENVQDFKVKALKMENLSTEKKSEFKNHISTAINRLKPKSLSSKMIIEYEEGNLIVDTTDFYETTHISGAKSYSFRVNRDIEATEGFHLVENLLLFRPSEEAELEAYLSSYIFNDSQWETYKLNNTISEGVKIDINKIDNFTNGELMIAKSCAEDDYILYACDHPGCQPAHADGTCAHPTVVPVTVFANGCGPGSGAGDPPPGPPDYPTNPSGGPTGNPGGSGSGGGGNPPVDDGTPDSPTTTDLFGALISNASKIVQLEENLGVDYSSFQESILMGSSMLLDEFLEASTVLNADVLNEIIDNFFEGELTASAAFNEIEEEIIKDKVTIDPSLNDTDIKCILEKMMEGKEGAEELDFFQKMLKIFDGENAPKLNFTLGNVNGNFALTSSIDGSSYNITLDNTTLNDPNTPDFMIMVNLAHEVLHAILTNDLNKHGLISFDGNGNIYLAPDAIETCEENDFDASSKEEYLAYLICLHINELITNEDWEHEIFGYQDFDTNVYYNYLTSYLVSSGIFYNQPFNWTQRMEEAFGNNFKQKVSEIIVMSGLSRTNFFVSWLSNKGWVSTIDPTDSNFNSSNNFWQKYAKVLHGKYTFESISYAFPNSNCN